MNAGVYAVGALLVATKLCDVASTLRRLEDAQSETNPIARPMMLRLGTTKAVWLVFLLALVIIAIASAAALQGGPVMQVLFIVVGTAIAIVQGAVALCNWTGRDNFITRRVRVAHSRLLRIMAR